MVIVRFLSDYLKVFLTSPQSSTLLRFPIAFFSTSSYVHSLGFHNCCGWKIGGVGVKLGGRERKWSWRLRRHNRLIFPLLLAGMVTTLSDQGSSCYIFCWLVYVHMYIKYLQNGQHLIVYRPNTLMCPFSSIVNSRTYLTDYLLHPAWIWVCVFVVSMLHTYSMSNI